MNLSSSLPYLVNAIIFSLLGFLIFGAGFVLFDKLTPYKLWDELVKEKNIALAIVVGSMAICLGMIVASAIHG